MLHTTRALRGMAVAPHALAAECALAVLRDGGNAAEATIAMAASLAVLYPHMTGLGGDSFWLLSAPGEPVRAIDACGRSAAGIDAEDCRHRFRQIPYRGPWAAITVAGTVSGWQSAFDHSRRSWAGRLPLTRLLADAIHYARDGCVVTDSQARCVAVKGAELKQQPGCFSTVYGGGAAGSVQRQPALAATLERLAHAGLADFYRGQLAQAMAAELERLGSPLRRDDLDRHRPGDTAPLALSLAGHLGQGTLYTTAPPTQGLATLLILGQFDVASPLPAAESADWLHVLVEATKSAFTTRDALICDPALVKADLDGLLRPEALARRAADIDWQRARPWPGAVASGDTTWFGVIDGEGRAVSCIQSLYHEFGSGVVLQDTGICWQNRGASFSLEKDHLLALAPRRKPFHTLCPSLARLDDGRTLVCGTMGGDGQPQTQAALLSRYLGYGMSLQQAVDAPRWLLGRTWGDAPNTLKLESRFDQQLIASLRQRGHELELVGAYDELVGHAGALVRHADGVLEGAADPRSDGAVAAF